MGKAFGGNGTKAGSACLMGIERQMRVVLSVFSGNEKILHVRKILESLGCEVEFVPSDSYRQVCPYWKKKLDEMGFHGGRRKYLQSVRDRFHHLLQDFRPDMVLFVNTPKDILSPDEVKEIGRSVPTVCWFVDGIEGRACENGGGHLNSFRRIYVFEHGDVAYLQKQNIEATYFPYMDQYLENGRVSSEEAAKLYARTKVCLNIHDPKHKSPNPRTFEILAAGSFVLTDEREYWGPLTPGKDVVGYENTEDLIAKLKIYLKDDAAREAIAANGRACVVDCMKTENLLRRILRGEDGEESRGR